MVKITLKVLAIYILVICTNIANATEVLCITNSPPYTDKNLASGGTLAEIVQQAFLASNVKTSLYHASWARMLHKAEIGECVLVGLWRSPERDNKFYYSAKPIVKQHLGLYTKSNQSLSALAGGTLAIQRFSYVPESLIKQNWHVYNVTSVYQGVDMLLLSRVDVLLAETGNMDWYLSKNEEFNHRIYKANPSLEVKLGYLAIAKTHERAKEILAAFDKGLDIVKKQSNLNNYFWLPK